MQAARVGRFGKTRAPSSSTDVGFLVSHHGMLGAHPLFAVVAEMLTGWRCVDSRVPPHPHGVAPSRSAWAPSPSMLSIVVTVWLVVVGRIRALHGARSRRGCRPSDARTDRIHARGIRCDASRATGNPPHPAARRVAPRRDAVDDAGSGGCWVLACAGCARAGGLRMPWRLSRSLAAGRRVVDHVHAGPIVS
jgi:hypothetical protein